MLLSTDTNIKKLCYCKETVQCHMCKADFGSFLTAHVQNSHILLPA